MARERLHHIVDELHGEIAKGDLSDTDRADLRSLLADLRGVLDEGVDSDDTSVLSDLQDATVRFETSHPQMTRALASVSELLRSIGIS